MTLKVIADSIVSTVLAMSGVNYDPAPADRIAKPATAVRMEIGPASSPTRIEVTVRGGWQQARPKLVDTPPRMRPPGPRLDDPLE